MRPFTSKTPRLLHLEEWPAQTGKTRVLIENPDRADLWAHADVLRRAGYDVAMCSGPTEAGEQQEHTTCPLLAEGHCPLVEGADVVVSTTQLTDGREILAALSARSTSALVVEGTRSELQREHDAIGGAVELTLPVLPQQIVEAVERARSVRATD
jgi:DNA-binding NtrC family response regulator